MPTSARPTAPAGVVDACAVASTLPVGPVADARTRPSSATTGARKTDDVAAQPKITVSSGIALPWRATHGIASNVADDTSVTTVTVRPVRRQARAMRSVCTPAS